VATLENNLNESIQVKNELEYAKILISDLETVPEELIEQVFTGTIEEYKQYIAALQEALTNEELTNIKDLLQNENLNSHFQIFESDFKRFLTATRNAANQKGMSTTPVGSSYRHVPRPVNKFVSDYPTIASQQAILDNRLDRDIVEINKPPSSPLGGTSHIYPPEPSGPVDLKALTKTFSGQQILEIKELVHDIGKLSYKGKCQVMATNLKDLTVQNQELLKLMESIYSNYQSLCAIFKFKSL
jgi:hypothetical protein